MRARRHPGSWLDLAKAAIEEEIAVVTVPGASAGISALIASRFGGATTTYLTASY